MTSDNVSKYRMTLSLNVLNHLGIGLYSNVPAVLSEAVANAWDADAKNVTITVDKNNETITIEDDGHGMTVDDVNNKYLRVGYKRREKPGEAMTPSFKRPVMGRKGIGKLSLFSIANVIEVHSIKDGIPHGFIMDLKQIEDAIKDSERDGTEKQYKPDTSENVKIDQGTKIILSNLKRQLRDDRWLRRRLARRFSIIGSLHQFNIVLNDEPIKIEDRGYFDKLQYIWTYGEKEEVILTLAKNQRHNESRPVLIGQDLNNESLEIRGWIGTVGQVGQLKDSDTKESLNKIVVMVRGKLAQEDILEEFGEGGVYSKYIIGEIHADFLDQDDKDDIATTSRQHIIEGDRRYCLLKEKLISELKHIQSEWTDLRNEDGYKKAIESPTIKEWYQELSSDHKNAAKKLMGKIYRLPIEDSDQRRQLLIGSLLAFESLKLRGLLDRIEEISVDNIDMISDLFVQLDDLEASVYYQISRERLEVIRKLTEFVDTGVKERVIQEHLYNHLWLLDPSWERATHTERMEKRIYNALDGVYKNLSEDERNSRLDIYYATTANKHVIIELKRATRKLHTRDISTQIDKYYEATTEVLAEMGKGDEPLEFVCLIGKQLIDWGKYGGKHRSYRRLKALDARVVMYDELIENALEAYQDYIDRGKKVGRVYDLIMRIEEEDFRSMSSFKPS